MANNDNDPPPKVAPKLKSAPKIRQLYWCDLPKDAQLPEFWKRRPVVVVSKNATLHGTVVVIACSTQAQPDKKLAFPLRTTIDGKAAWAVCDKPMTVAVSRLVPTHGAIVRIPQDEFDEMLTVMLDLLPRPAMAGPTEKVVQKGAPSIGNAAPDVPVKQAKDEIADEVAVLIDDGKEDVPTA